MPRSLFTPLVVVFWCLATGWLVADKILPTFRSRPPTGAHIAVADDGTVPPVAWTVAWDERPVGTAVSEAHRPPEGGLVIDSRMKLRRLPLTDLVPPWLAAVVRQTLPDGLQISLEATTRFSVDDAGKPRGFVSTIDLPESGETISVTGRVADGTIHVTVASRGLRYETSRPLPDTLLLADELSPHASLPGLVVGQRWTAPVFSPLRPGQSSIELLEAHVERETLLFDDDEPVTARIVSYRDGGAGDRPPRLRLWVDRAGRVLRQEAAIGGSRLSFLRRPDEQARSMAEALGRAGGTDRRPDAPAPSPAGSFAR
ncbi:MAG: hypothetical protein ACKOCW_06425 [Planctomycetaceae bacterium]